jgi:hypothetical protein
LSTGYSVFMPKTVGNQGSIFSVFDNKSTLSQTADVFVAKYPIPNGATVSESKFIYKFIYGVGECGLNKYGLLGWSIAQYGNAATDQHFDRECNVSTTGVIYDYVILQAQQ